MICTCLFESSHYYFNSIQKEVTIKLSMAQVVLEVLEVLEDPSHDKPYRHRTQKNFCQSA